MTRNFKFLLYWMSDKTWFYEDKNGNFHLTDLATPKAIESFKAWNDANER